MGSKYETIIKIIGFEIGWAIFYGLVIGIPTSWGAILNTTGTHIYTGIGILVALVILVEVVWGGECFKHHHSKWIFKRHKEGWWNIEQTGDKEWHPPMNKYYCPTCKRSRYE